MNKKEIKMLIPKLRFPEFVDARAWQPEVLTKIFHFQDGFAFKSTDFVENGEETIQVIRITDINNKNSNADKVFAPKQLIRTLKLEKYTVSNGDLLLSLTGAAGFNFFFWNDATALLNQRTCKITPRNNSDASLPRLLEPLIHEKINSKGEGQNNNLSKEFLNEIEIPVPEQKEQQKIADCLSSIDELISAQSQKVEALKTHKKGLMQQLFPREGETVPRLRFPEFSDAEEWKPNTLERLAKFRRGSFPQPYGLPEWYDDENGMPFVQVFDVADNLRLKGKTKNKISKLGAEQSVFIAKGTLIVTLQGSIGRVAITQYDAYIDRTLLIFEEFFKPTEILFFAYVIQNIFEIEKEKAPGGIIKTITKESLSDFVVKLPSHVEQQKIADCLSSIDELISTQGQELEAFKAHKKGLMQQLFPATNEVDA